MWPIAPAIPHAGAHWNLQSGTRSRAPGCTVKAADRSRMCCSVSRLLKYSQLARRADRQLPSNEDLIDPNTTLSVFKALYSLGRAFFEAFAERGADFI